MAQQCTVSDRRLSVIFTDLTRIPQGLYTRFNEYLRLCFASHPEWRCIGCSIELSFEFWNMEGRRGILSHVSLLSCMLRVPLTH
jgi:hypothetical protein